MLKAIKILAATAIICVTLGLTAGACGYAGVSTAGDAVVIARNDNILFGLLRKVYVCKITPQGLSQCSKAEAP